MSRSCRTSRWSRKFRTTAILGDGAVLRTCTSKTSPVTAFVVLATGVGVVAVALESSADHGRRPVMRSHASAHAADSPFASVLAAFTSART